MAVKSAVVNVPTTDVAIAALNRAIDSGWQPSCMVAKNHEGWVRLLVPISDWSHNEALLLCRESDQTWLAWVPDHGETVLHRDQFE